MYLVKRILKLNYKNLFKTINRIYENTNKSKLIIFIDIIYCGIKYKAGYTDYDLFEMYNLNSRQRKTILTRGINNKFIKKYNNKNFKEIFNNKLLFNKKFKKYLKREYMIIKKSNKVEFINFIKDKDYIIAKPINGTHGDGIVKLKANANIYSDLLKSNSHLIEENIIQNKKMNKLNPSCINTLRIVTIFDKGISTIICVYLRVGKNKIVDNFNNGGMVVPVNNDTGIIEYPAIDKEGNIYYEHPNTKTKFIGFKIPYFNDAKKLCLNASKEINEVKYIGWDVAISDKGPCIIEGNDYPGHDIYQLPNHRTNGIGILPTFIERMKR